MAEQERYVAVPIGVNGTYTSPQGTRQGTGVFMCVTAGTMSIADANGNALLTGFPMVAGSNNYIPLYFGSGFVLMLAGGASGTLGVQ